MTTVDAEIATHIFLNELLYAPDDLTVPAGTGTEPPPASLRIRSIRAPGGQLSVPDQLALDNVYEIIATCSSVTHEYPQEYHNAKPAPLARCLLGNRHYAGKVKTFLHKTYLQWASRKADCLAVLESVDDKGEAVVESFSVVLPLTSRGRSLLKQNGKCALDLVEKGHIAETPQQRVAILADMWAIPTRSSLRKFISWAGEKWTGKPGHHSAWKRGFHRTLLLRHLAEYVPSLTSGRVFHELLVEPDLQSVKCFCSKLKETESLRNDRHGNPTLKTFAHSKQSLTGIGNANTSPLQKKCVQLIEKMELLRKTIPFQ